MPPDGDLEQRIGEALAAALRDFEREHISVFAVNRGLATGHNGQAIIRLTIGDVAAIAARVARGEPE